MASRGRGLAELDLEQALQHLGPLLDYPPTPNLANEVGDLLAERPSRPSFLDVLWRLRRPALVALLVLLALAGIGLGLFPSARSAVAQRLGLRGVTITRLPANPSGSGLPAPAPTSALPGGLPVGRTPLATPPCCPTPPVTATAAPGATPRPSLGSTLHLGQPVTLNEAQRLAGFTLLLPRLPQLGGPDETCINTLAGGPEVAFVYRAAPGRPPSASPEMGLLFMEFQARLEGAYLGKGIGPDTTLEQLTVNGGPGFWLQGAPHAFFYQQPNGQVGPPEDFRLATNTLLWEQNGLTVRVEGPATKEEALAIAASVR